jgi:hypothetical protein
MRSVAARTSGFGRIAWTAGIVALISSASQFKNPSQPASTDIKATIPAVLAILPNPEVRAATERIKK